MEMNELKARQPGHFTDIPARSSVAKTEVLVRTRLWPPLPRRRDGRWMDVQPRSLQALIAYGEISLPRGGIQVKRGIEQEKVGE